jgi:hypothetical protein
VFKGGEGNVEALLDGAELESLEPKEVEAEKQTKTDSVISSLIPKVFAEKEMEESPSDKYKTD